MSIRIARNYYYAMEHLNDRDDHDIEKYMRQLTV